MKRNASFNLDEIKVRWKKAALENCTGVPCVVAPSFTCGTSTVSDYDGNVYETVSIVGTSVTQCWTKSNLKVTRYNDGTLITDLTNLSDASWLATPSGARTEYVNSGVPLSGYVGTYGYLYNWYAVADSRKLCPTGWHVPSKDEWDILISYLGTNAGGKMQLISTLWSSQSSGANNSSGFTAIPGGQGGGPISNFISSASYFWSSSERPTGGVGAPSASNIRLENSLNLFNEYIDQYRGLSVRCLKD
jgi:uncharacterized protein (TIGR02145 family)